MNTFAATENLITFKTGYDTGFIADVKLITGRRYHPETRSWSCPLLSSNTSAIEALIDKYHISGEFANSIDQTVFQPGPTIGITLRPYQERGVQYCLKYKKTINGSDMGTGKTFMTVAAIEQAGLFPCVVVVPVSVKYNWEAQWGRVNPSRKISFADDCTGDVNIITYGNLVSFNLKRSAQKVAIKISSLVFDESQALKNSSTKRSKAAKKLSKGVGYVFMLTGTAIMNRPEELINPLAILGHLDAFGGWINFTKRYCNAFQTRFGIDTSGASNLQELNEMLRNICYYRVEKREALPYLPARQETIIEVELDNAKEYNKALAGIIECPADNPAFALVQLNVLSELCVEGKMSSIKEWMDTFLESTTDKLVIFGSHVQPLKDLSLYYQCPIITGEVDAKKRHSIVQDFQASEDRFLFMNILTGSVGIDGLQNICHDVLFIELPWRPSDLEQAISRVERDGQKNQTESYFILGKGAVDSKVWNLLQRKKQVTERVIKGVEIKDTDLTIMEIYNKL